METEQRSKLEADRQLLEHARQKGGFASFMAYLKLSGPGWLQSALTLGGGSLSSSLYLGVLAGFSLMWLQPLAMILGIIMLSAIGYVTMSTGERPFQAINRHVNPVLGWGWALASMAANIVWSLPQYSLANGVLQQNLLPGVLGPESALGDFGGKLVVSCSILVVTTIITWGYDRGGLGVKLYESMLKVVVALIVACFVGVVLKLAFSDEGIAWGTIAAGFVPNFGALFTPAETFQPLLDTTGDFRDYWTNLIVNKQRDVLIAAAATAVGINMTFLFPYSLLKRGWGKEFRGLAIFDLSTGMLIPFLLATSCVVIASATQFHGQPQPGLLAPSEMQAATSSESATGATASKKQKGEFNRLLRNRLAAELGSDVIENTDAARLDEMVAALPVGDRRIAATLVTRDAFDLSRSLEPLLGRFFGDVIFGLGVLAMALSTITLLMLVSGLVFCEVFGLPPTGWPYRFGCLLAATGALGPFLWSKAAFWLAVPTSVFGLMLLPIAYLTFFLLMNQKSLLGDQRPEGGRRILWNVLMGISATIASCASIYMVGVKAGTWGIALIIGFVSLALIVQVARRPAR
ncbi:MAG: divalent metal cation transporter [Planctomycetes bacterium]|nr:divalent metal cation transporter [Planctomycetota bacterium]